MEKVNIFLDVDDTLIKSSELMLNKLNTIYGFNHSTYDIKHYSFNDLFPEMERSKLLDLFDDKDFYNEVEPIEHSLYVINSYRESSFYKMSICTVGRQNNLLNKYNWIMDNIHGEIDIHGIPIGCSKCKIDMSGGIQIDDHTDMLRSTNAKVKILITNGYKRRYNNILPNEDIYVVDNWYEIEEILRFYESVGNII